VYDLVVTELSPTRLRDGPSRLAQLPASPPCECPGEQPSHAPVTSVAPVTLLHAGMSFGGRIVVLGVVAVTWLILASAFLFLWAGFHARQRAADGIDEAAYLDGLDDDSLAEAA
jgi:hypothetical protein